MISLFYTAVQWSDAKLAVLGKSRQEKHPINHVERMSAVSTNLRHVSAMYLVLKERSEYARYTVGSERNIDADYVNECQKLLDSIIQDTHYANV